MEKNLRHRTLLTLLFVAFTSLSLFSGCDDSSTNPTVEKSLGIPAEFYKAPKDICGEIIFQENIGENFQQALDEILKRKMDQGWNNIFLATTKLQEVTDAEGNIVNKTLYLVVVKDKDTNRKVHAWHEVIDDHGNLFYINWCPD